MRGLSRPASDVLTELLDAQKAALLSGDIAALTKLEAPLGLAFERLKRQTISDPVMLRIREAARRNAVLLKAAQSGLATARLRVSNQMSSGLTVYDAQGNSRSTSDASSRLLARR